MELQWKHGGPRFGVEPELKNVSIGENGFEFTAFARTSGESSAVLIAEAIDKDGKIISEYKSEPVKAADWKKITLPFPAPAGTAKVKVYCFNEGQGTVSFSGAEFKGSKTKVEEAFPIHASCLPVEMMKELNGGKGEFNTFADRPVPLAFEFRGDIKNFKVKSLVIEIPADVKLLECFNSHMSLMNEEKPVIEQITRDGKAYTRYTFNNPKVFRILRPVSAWERKLVVALLPENKNSFGSKGMVYWYMKADEKKSAENSFALNILPPMAKTANPKNFPLICWGTHDINFNNPEIFEKVAEIHEEVGATIRGRGNEKTAERDIILEKRDWKMKGCLSDYMHGTRIANSSDDWNKIKEKVEFRIMETGKMDKEKMCPQYMINDPDIKAYIKKLILGKLKADGVKNGEAVSLDIEPWEPMTWCFCERCRKDFAAYCKLDKVPEISEIKAKHKEAWRDFRSLNTSEFIKLHCDVIKESYPASKIMDYDYIVKFNRPDFRDRYYSVAKDPQLNEKYFDVHISSYYHYIDKDAFDMIDINVKNLKKDYWVLGAIDNSGSYLSAKEVISPAQARMLILASATSGAKAAGFYPGIHIDGKFFLEIDRAMTEVALLEKFFMEGKRIDAEFNVAPLPYFSKKVKVGDKEIEIIRPDWKNCFGYRAHAVDGKKLLSIFNYNSEKKLFATVSAQMPDGKYTVIDALSNKRILPKAGKDSWDALEINKGFLCDVPVRDIRFLILRPFNEKDVEIPIGSDAENIGREFDSAKKDFADAPRLLEPVKRDKLEIAYDDIHKDGQLQITLASLSQKLWIDPECGGILTEWNADGKSICKAGLDIQNRQKSMCWDFFWQPRSIRDSAASLPVSIEKSGVNDGIAFITLKNELKKASIEILKTYEINAMENGFTLKYNIKNKGDKDFSFSFWSHNFPKLAEEKLNENMRILLHLGDGAREIGKDTGTFVFAESENHGFKNINGLLAGNRFGVWAVNEKYGITAEVEKSKLMGVYIWWDVQPTLEWMYKEVSLPQGAEWKTEIKYSFFDKTDVNGFCKEIEKL